MSEVRIAVVDDDKLVRSATSSLLRSLGYAARTYPSATALLDDDIGDLDVVLSDYQMPEVTGLQLLAILQARAEPIPVVIMTAYSGGDIAESARRMGAAGFVRKPLDETALIAALTAALAGD